MSEDRDFDARPYSVDEERVAQFFSDVGVGGGADPIGALMAGYVYLSAERNELRKQLEKEVRRADELYAENVQLRRTSEEYLSHDGELERPQVHKGYING